MATLSFTELYMGDCENCGVQLEDWEWYEDDFMFRTTCTCGSDYTLEPTVGVLTCETAFDDEDDDEDE
jgi:hypothetical protein